MILTVKLNTDIRERIEVDIPIKITIQGITYFGNVISITADRMKIQLDQLINNNNRGKIDSLYYYNRPINNYSVYYYGGYYGGDEDVAVVETEPLGGGII